MSGRARRRSTDNSRYRTMVEWPQKLLTSVILLQIYLYMYVNI